jgi:hypothetical protein
MTDITQGLPTEVQETINPSTPGPQPTGFSGPQGSTYDSGQGRVPAPQVPMRPQGQPEDTSEEESSLDAMAKMAFKHFLDTDRAAKGLPVTSPQPARPGSFADKLHAATGLGNAIAAGLGDASEGARAAKETGGGWLSGIEGTMGARQKRMAAEKQQSFENAERKRNDDVNYAHAQIANLQAQQALRHATQEDKKESLEYNNAMADSLDQVGTQIVKRGVTGEEVQKWMADDQNKEQRNSVTAVIDHFLPPDKNGFEQPVYNLYSAVPEEVHLSPKIAKLLTDFGPTGESYQAGSEFQGSMYVRAVNSALSKQAADLARQKVVSETTKNNAEAAKADQDTEAKKKRNAIAGEPGFMHTMTSFGWSPLPALDAAEAAQKNAKTPEQKDAATKFAQQVTEYYGQDVIAAERSKAAEIAQKAMDANNTRADRKLDNEQKAGNEALMKSTEKFGDFSRQIGTMQANIKRAQNGDELANSMEPLFAALNIATSAGVHRINQTEIDQAGARVGSLYRRWNNLIDKAATGTMDDAMYKEASDLATSLQSVAYDKYVGTALIRQKNNKLPDDTMIYGADGHNSTTIGEARKVREQADREDYAATTGQAPKGAPTFNNGTVYRGDDGKYYVTATGQPYVPKTPQQPQQQ